MWFRGSGRFSLVRVALPIVVAGSLVTTTCSSSESSAPSTTGATTAPPTTAAPSSTAPVTTTPPSTAPASTAPASTAPPTTAPVTISPATTTAPPPDVDLTQFCFDSEQVYVATGVIDELTEPTPAQAEAALQFLVFAAESSVQSAPEGFGDEPDRFLEIASELDAVFAGYDYDITAMSEDDAPDGFLDLLDEYDAIRFDQLAPFLDDQCASPLDLLDVQVVKLAPVVDTLALSDLVAITNQVGDIRLLVPADWSDLIGSTESGEVTLLQAAPDIESFDVSWEAAGVLAIAYYIEAGVAEPSLRIAGTQVDDGCTPVASEPYDDGFYTGELATYGDCGGVGTDAVVVAVANADGSVEATFEFQFPDGLDRELLDQILIGLAVGA